MTVKKNSLQNLRLRSGKKGEKGSSSALSTQVIDEIFTLLTEDTSVKEIAKKTNVCIETVRKYINHGDARRGIKPLRYRLTLFHDKISSNLSVICEEARLTHLSHVKSILEVMHKKLFGETIKDEDGNYVHIDGQVPNFTFKDYERMVTLHMKLLGATSNMNDNNSGNRETKMLTAEQIMGSDDG